MGRVIFKTVKLPKRKIILLAGLFILLGLSWSVASSGVEAIMVMAHPFEGKTVVIDPGHGGIDPGAVGQNGVEEKKIVLVIAKKTGRLFSHSGARVILTRETDKDFHNYTGPTSHPDNPERNDLQARVDIANNAGADIFISIHANSFPGEACYGAQVFYHPQSKEGEELAKSIQAQFHEVFGDSGRLAKKDDFFVLRNAKMPAALVEVGFLSTISEERLLADAIYQERIAWAIYAGTVKYYINKDKKQQPIQQP